MKTFAPSSCPERLGNARWYRRCRLAGFVALAVVPPLWGIGYALAYSVGLAGALSPGFSLEAWSRLAAPGGEIVRSFGFSIAVAAAALVLATGAALGLALGLRRELTSGPAATALLVPLALPGIVGALLAFVWFSGAGWFARGAWHLGLIGSPADFPALINDRLGLGIVLTHAALATPLLTLLFVRLHANERLDELVALARTLGAGPWAVLRRVVLPILLRRAAPSLTLLFAAVLGSYEIPLVLGAQRPEMLSVLARRKFALFDLSLRPEAFVIAVLYAALVFTLVLVVFRKAPPADVS